jgi:hypothetical protein
MATKQKVIGPKVKDLFERYNGRLTVQEANAEVFIEVFGETLRVASVQWTRSGDRLVLGVDETELERRFTPEVRTHTVGDDLLPIPSAGDMVAKPSGG